MGMGTHANSSWGLVVAQEEGEHIVRAIMAGLGDEGQIWRIGSAISVSGRLLVGVGAGQGVAQLARSGETFSLVIRAVLDLSLDKDTSQRDMAEELQLSLQRSSL